MGSDTNVHLTDILARTMLGAGKGNKIPPEWPRGHPPDGRTLVAIRYRYRHCDVGVLKGKLRCIREEELAL